MSKKRKIFNIIAAVLKYVILIFGALFTLMPFLWMIISSLKTPAEIIAIPPTLRHHRSGPTIQRHGVRLRSQDIS